MKHHIDSIFDEMIEDVLGIKLTIGCMGIKIKDW